MNLHFIYAGFCLLSSVFCGLMGYRYADIQREREIAQIQEQMKAQEVIALQNKNEKENVYSKALITTQSKIAISNDRIAATFSNLNAWADSNFVIDNSVSLHNEDNTGSNTDMSSTASTAGAVSDCECRCDDKNAAKLRRLYQEQLIVARDCDITATHYNALIEFYGSVSAPLGGVEKNTSFDSRPRP